MNILVVDDEADVQLLFEQIFRREIRNGDVSLSFARSGEEALGRLSQNDSEFVLILSDINMPGMSGLELLRRVKKNHPTPPPIVMMITAYGDVDTYNQAMEYGANDFLTKPLDFVELKQRLKAMLENPQ